MTCSRKRHNSRACRRLAEDDRQTDAVVAKTCLAKRPGGMVAQQSALPSQASPFPRLPVLFVPLLLVAMFAAAALLALSLPLGSFCRDVAVDPDAFQRMRSGQAPAIDFFAPVGSMGYDLGGWLHQVFPLAQPILLVNWALVPVLLPIAVPVLVQHGARRHALALVVPPRKEKLTPSFCARAATSWTRSVVANRSGSGACEGVVTLTDCAGPTQ